MSGKKKIGFGRQEKDDIPEKTEPTEEDGRIDLMANQLLDEFCRKYAIAQDLTNSTHQFTTAEILSAIKSFIPSTKISVKIITLNLINRGYKYTVICDNVNLQYKWLLVEKL